MVNVGNGEVVSLTEFVARMMANGIAEKMNKATLRTIKSNVGLGASFEDIRPFYMRELPTDSLKAFADLKIDLDVVFKRMHDALVRAVVD